MKEWRLIRSGPMTAAENMALDEVLLESVAQELSGPVLRFYRWRPAAVTLGYGQRGRRTADHEACRSLGIDVARRITGGRAVLHDREVTYSVVSPERTDLFPGGISGNYRVIAEVLRRALAELGLPAELAAGRTRGAAAQSELRRNACFTSPSMHELVYQGCKLTGSAQKRFGGAFLQHGSIPVELDLERLFRVLHGGDRLDPAAGARMLSRRIGWLNRWLDRRVTIDELEDRLLAAFAESWRMKIIRDQPTGREKRRMQALAAKKYADPDWHLQNSAMGMESVTGG